MAKSCFKCSKVCACFLLLFTVSAALPPNQYYEYKTESAQQRPDYTLALEQLKDTHILHKRGVPPGPVSEPILDNRSNPSTTPPSSSPIPDPIPTKNKNGKLPKNAAAANNATKTIVLQKETTLQNHKLLGVNGSGQYRNITTIKPTLKPINQSSPLTPLVRNETVQQAKSNETYVSDSDEDEDELLSVPENSEKFNHTLLEHNITKIKEDAHIYYNSTLQTDSTISSRYWNDLSNRSDVKVNEVLSRSHRRAATVKLSFEFPFYGHLIKNVTVATGGFLYSGEYVHSWLAATQYIAPLMANFDTSLSNDSFIKYVDNGTAFTVEWERVSLRDMPKEGEFTFQVTLHQNGDIVFVYQNVPLFIKNIEDDHHPVKVGLSDAYIMDSTTFFVRRKTIYEYHRINFEKEDIKNGTVIYLKALPTCLDSKTCTACLTRKLTSFTCSWCPSINICSNGLDRHRQDWLVKGCGNKQLFNESMCSHISGSDIFDEYNMTYSHDSREFQAKLKGVPNPSSSRVYDNSSGVAQNQPVKMGVSGIVAILFLLAMVAGLISWILYAYRNPHTTSGQIFIRYRPSQWRWRRGEARYTAATIHM